MSYQAFKGPHAHHTYQCTTGNEYFSNEEGFIHGARHLSGEHLGEIDPRDLQELERMGVKPTDEMPSGPIKAERAEDATFESEGKEDEEKEVEEEKEGGEDEDGNKGE